MTDANKLAESLRAMRRNARNHFTANWEGGCYSITMSAVRLGDLTDAADLIEKLAAEVSALKDAPAVLLTDEQALATIPDCHGSSLGKTWLLAASRAVEAASLAANGKAVS